MPLQRDNADQRDEATSALQELRSWIKFKLEHGPIKHIDPNADSSGPYQNHPHGWAAVCVPDWDMRQKLALIEEALKSLAQGAGHAPPQAEKD